MIKESLYHLSQKISVLFVQKNRKEITMQTLAAAVILINLITFAAYGADKYFAIRQKRRISEKSLLVMAILGGSVGAIAAMRVFRHKTQKFKGVLGIIVIIQLIAVWGVERLFFG